MKKILFVVLLLAFAVPTYSKFSESDITLVYSGLRFKVPGDHLAVGSKGGEDIFLVFKYKNQAIKSYIAFSRMIKEPNVNYNCELNDFIESAFLKREKTKCNTTELNAFAKVFLNGKDHGVWENEGFFLYYTLSKKDAFLFVIDPKGAVIKIDSDFVDKAGLKRIASEILK